MTFEAAKEIADKIDSLEEQASQGSFVPHGRQDVLTAAIGRAEHPDRVRVAGAGVTINQMQSQFQSQMQSQGLGLPPEHMVGPSGPRVSIKESCVDPSGNNLETGVSGKCGLYIEGNPPRLVALGRVYEGSTVHNIPLLPDQVKVGVEEVKDAQAPVPVPTDEVTLVGQALNTFLAWPIHLVKPLSEQATVSLAKPPQRLDSEVDDPLYLMTLTIPEIFLKPFQCNRQKESIECGYYVMHWMSTIILGSFRNNWETYFNDARPLEPERLKALRI
ncbi:hypothetical protein HKD37_14G040431 [Glycine soja]